MQHTQQKLFKHVIHQSEIEFADTQSDCCTGSCEQPPHVTVTIVDPSELPAVWDLLLTHQDGLSMSTHLRLLLAGVEA